MNKGLTEIKQNVFDKLFFIYVIFFSGAATSAIRTPGALMLLGFGAAVVLLLHGMLPRRSFWAACTCWMIYFILSTVSLGSFHPYFMVEIPILMLAGYALVNIWGRELFRHYSRVVYVLSIISLIFYSVHLVMPEVIRWIIAKFDCQGGLFQHEWRNCGSVIIYTINEALDESIPRNCGFCWEPGPFACFVALALFFNYVILDKQPRRVNAVLIAALLTTFSTTGYMMLGFLILYYIFNHNNAVIRFCTVMAAIAAVVIFIQVDFLGQKVQEQIEMIELWSTHLEHSRLYNKHYTPGRFISMKLALLNFEQRPLFGYAGNTYFEYSRELGASVAIISGIGYILARYGLFGIFFYVALLAASSYYLFRISRYRNYGVIWLWIILNIMIGISFKLTFSPIFFAFLFSGLFTKNSKVSTITADETTDSCGTETTQLPAEIYEKE